MRSPVFVDRIRFIASFLKLVRRDRWSRERLLQHQARSLERLRRFALARSPFYQRLHKGLENAPLAELPVVTKGQLMAAFDEAVTDRALRLAEVKAFVARMGAGDLFNGRYQIVATSGTTGERGYFPFSPSEWRLGMANGGRAFAWSHGGRPAKGERSAMMSTSVPWHMSARMSTELRRLRLGMDQETLDSGDPIATIVAKLNAYQPTIMTVYPSMMQVLAGEQTSGRLKIAPKRVQCSSEVLTDDAREAIAQAFHVAPSNLYAASECVGALAVTCSDGRGLHICEDLCIVEVVDEGGRAAPAGEAGAKVLLTVLGSRTLPLIRYELNDRLTLARGPCGCGLPFACIDAVGGRSGEVLNFAAQGGGTVSLSPMQVGAALRGLPVTGWQFTVSPNELVIACVTPTSAFPAEAIVARVAALLVSHRAVVPKLSAVRIDRLTRGASGKSAVIQTATQSARVPA